MLTFGQPLALWAFAALALPVLAHMAYRQVTQRYPFPSLRFIKPARIPRTGRKTPTDWPLLLLRTLLFAALACLMADPYWKEPPRSESRGAGRETIIALDLSPSMSGWGGLTEAKEKAKALLERIEGHVGYVGFGSDVLAEVPPSENEASVRVAISNAVTDLGRGNPQAGIDRAAKLFSPEAQERQLVILSDMQRSDWQAAYRRLDEEGVAVDLLPVGHARKVGSKREGNLTLSEAKAAPAGPGKVRAWAVIRNSSNVPQEATLAVEAGGEAREKKSVSVPANGAAQA
ncbi:MAG: VWA domain-containing protein, partial [Opitutales bacterium]